MHKIEAARNRGILYDKVLSFCRKKRIFLPQDFGIQQSCVRDVIMSFRNTVEPPQFLFPLFKHGLLEREFTSVKYSVFNSMNKH